jgi:hypothetical protein
MKKFLLCLLVIFATSSSSLAAETYFGVGLRSYFIAPLPSVQVGYDFESRETGFGVRAGLSSVLFFTDVVVDGYYRIPLDDTGSGFYGGLGVGALLSFGFNQVAGSTAWHVHALIGWSRTSGPASAWMLELTPGIVWSNPNITPYIAVSFGFNFYV